MSTIDLDALLSELSPESPCGEDLEYDTEFQEMERASVGKAEQQFGDTFVPAEEPDWKVVKTKALGVLGRSRDLRAAVFLTRAAVHTDGLSGFADGLKLVHGLMTTFWEGVHPALDPDDDNDPTLRVNTVASLCDSGSTIRSLREAPLVESQMMGRFSLRDIEVAQGELPPPEEGDPPQMPTIEAAFLECDLEELQARGDALAAAAETVAAMDQFLTETLGASQAPDMSALPAVIHSLKGVIDSQLLRRGVGEEEEGAEGAEGEGAVAGAVKGLSGEIRNTDDVLRALDKIIDYYNRNEPSSPLPILMTRAKRLVSKSFMEILADLAPSGVTEAEAIRGVDTESY